MDLDELQSVQSRERQTDSLQQLRATFYQDAAEFVQGLETERDRAAERADDPWNSPEVGRLNDDIDTAEQTVEAIYERRVGKIVKMASLAAADMPTENEGLTEEERKLFETLVAAIEQNRDHVFAILDGEPPVETGDQDRSDPTAADAEAGDTTAPGQSPDRSRDAPGGRESHPAPKDLSDGPDRVQSTDDPATAGAGTSGTDEGAADESRVDAADLMGGADSAAPVERSDGGVAVDDPAPAPDPAAPREQTDADTAGVERDATNQGDEQRSDESEGSDAATGSGATVDRTTVKITADVGEIFGVDERAYDLTEDDVVTLPEPNATPLVDSDAAERLD